MTRQQIRGCEEWWQWCISGDRPHGTSGEMVADILGDWEIERGELIAALKAVEPRYEWNRKRDGVQYAQCEYCFAYADNVAELVHYGNCIYLLARAALEKAGVG